MPNVAAGAVSAGFAFVLAAMVSAVLIGVSRNFADARMIRARYVALATIVAGALLAACISGGSVAAGCAAAGGACAGAWFAQRADLASRPRLLAALGSNAGLVAIAGALVRYFSAAAQDSAGRVELYVAVFAGALLFAASAIALVRLNGTLDTCVDACPGCAVVDLSALLLGVGLGYGFVTDGTQVSGLAALLAAGGLAAALGAHLMMTVDDRYGLSFAMAHGDRSNVHCSAAQRRRAVPARFEWQDDSMRVRPGDDFTQRWTLADADMHDSWRVAAAPRSVHGAAPRGRSRRRQRIGTGA